MMGRRDVGYGDEVPVVNESGFYLDVYDSAVANVASSDQVIYQV
jgi:hypothetical protein